MLFSSAFRFRFLLLTHFVGQDFKLILHRILVSACQYLCLLFFGQESGLALLTQFALIHIHHILIFVCIWCMPDSRALFFGPKATPSKNNNNNKVRKIKTLAKNVH